MTETPQVGIIVTSRAAKVMRDQLTRRGTPQASVRLGIRGGGCTGYSYLFEFDDREPRASDHVVTVDGVRVVVDPKSMILLKGTTVDFETGMRGHGFKFTNPNVKDACGCGESVTLLEAIEDNRFDVLGVPLATPSAEVQLVVANLGSPDADVYLGTSRRGGVSVAAGGQMLRFQPTAPMPAALGTSRFFLVTEPITVACVPDADGSFSLVRFSGYGWQGVQPASTAALGGAQQAVLMQGLQRCSMTYSTALANIGLLNLALGLGEAGGATHMDLLHQVALDNTP